MLARPLQTKRVRLSPGRGRELGMRSGLWVSVCLVACLFASGPALSDDEHSFTANQIELAKLVKAVALTIGDKELEKEFRRLCDWFVENDIPMAKFEKIIDKSFRWSDEEGIARLKKARRLQVMLLNNDPRLREANRRRIARFFNGWATETAGETTEKLKALSQKLQEANVPFRRVKEWIDGATREFKDDDKAIADLEKRFDDRKENAGKIRALFERTAGGLNESDRREWLEIGKQLAKQGLAYSIVENEIELVYLSDFAHGTRQRLAGCLEWAHVLLKR